MKISKEKRDKISEQILAFLYSQAPRSLYTVHIAKEIARDEEFIKNLLQELKKKSLIIEIKKNRKGKPYLRRSRWRLSELAYKSYKKAQ